IALVEAYAKRQGLWHDPSNEAAYSEYLELDLSTVVPSIAGPKRPQDRIVLSQAKASFRQVLPSYAAAGDTMTNAADTDGPCAASAPAAPPPNNEPVGKAPEHRASRRRASTPAAV